MDNQKKLIGLYITNEKKEIKKLDISIFKNEDWLGNDYLILYDVCESEKNVFISENVESSNIYGPIFIITSQIWLSNVWIISSNY